MVEGLWHKDARCPEVTFNPISKRDAQQKVPASHPKAKPEDGQTWSPKPVDALGLFPNNFC